ncbi:helix-turn-helix domain-containing protein [Allomuricauda taeanensis]|uniref:helix-turn-helix domain-containing protein n=1 Tax=Flagellimonas taeanensis TaxID=1005926 RepID=UPI002E7B20EA|nr:helix-turn-helix domain-containing protein [Allomuricauda taeanensis]MEE1961996.1 helix-turn-helix domain-containing protein [Allomuricauda taeanensis]
MGKIYLQSLELSDIKRVIEEVVESNLSKLSLPKHQNQNLLLTRKETAKLLCISLPTLNDWTKTGIVKAHRIGNRVLYKEQEVLEALNEVRTLRTGRGTSC